MFLVRAAALLVAILFALPFGQSTAIHVMASDAIDLARLVARDEGYDVRNTKVYSFDFLITSDGKPLIRGYTSVGFYINGSVRSGISISETTGQTIDMDTCEVFDYPDLRPFQEEIVRLSKARKKTPDELAQDAGCSPARILTKPIPFAKDK
jgi:hypothetical protein